VDDSETILDYASPRKRLRLRLPAASSILVNYDENQVIVQEWLQGQKQAIAAIAFACCTYLYMAILFFGESEIKKTDPTMLAVLATLVVTGIVVMLMVIHQTWRKTILTVRYDQMLLDFVSPFYSRHYRWASRDIAEISLLETANMNSPAPLAELRITRSSEGEIRLFTDHLTHQLRPIADALPAMLRHGELVSVIATPVLPIPEDPVNPTAGGKRTPLA
jgi:hypothetical protein